ncbi:histidine kinase [Stackebrandtia endophytica]|uniref:Histidine kinase n=1 Tax=Stackebrandtia endophytica TaxID=1496996 RepID=A0A543B0V6_9ACTN|nr:GAF domain-containing protein [Stackebrandtia endophytica]TQL78462.1 histidine kinase [Stackebrandtia endophytica]
MNGRHRVVIESDLDALCQMVCGVVDCDAVVIALWNDTGSISIGAANLDHSEAGDLASRFHPDEAASSLGHTGSRDPVAVDRPSARSIIGDLGFTSLVRSPLTLNNRVAGLMFVLSRTGPDEADHDLRLVHALARSCESALEFGRDATVATSLSEVDSIALHATSFPTLMSAIRRVISSAIGPVSVGLSVQDEESGLLLTADGSFGLPREVTTRYFIDSSDLHSNAARVYETQRPFVSNHVIGDPAILQSYPIAFRIESMIALPLSVSGRPTGVLMVADKPGGFHPDDVDTVAKLTPHIAIAVELAKLSEANRFELDAEHIISDLGIAIGSPILNLARFEPTLRSLAHIVQADHLTVTDGSGPLLTVGVPVREPRFSFEQPCGNLRGKSLSLQVTRSFGRAFSRGQRRLLQESARLLTEGLVRTTAARQETELAQHRERQRIADDLHDDVSQLLFSAQMTLEAHTSGEGPTGDAVRRVSELVRRAETELRDAIFVLNSPQTGLSDALTEVQAELESGWDLDTRLILDASIDPVVPADVAEVLARAAREALVNVAKHAHARSAEVVTRLTDDDHVELRVVDDGTGTSGLTTAGHGLTSLRRRVGDLGGSVIVDGRVGAGTAVTLRVPLSPRTD